MRPWGPMVQDATQLVRLTMSDPNSAGAKPAREKPWSSQATPASIPALTTSRKRPRVTTVIGK